MDGKTPLRIGIIDDDQGTLSLLAASIKSLMEKRNVASEIRLFSTPEPLLDPRNQSLNDFDLLFCDIEMPKMDGISLAGKYQKNHPACTLIFISNREDRVFDSLKVHPYGFIRKRYFLDDISSMIDSYLEMEKKKTQEPSILLSVEGNMERFLLKDIIFIESRLKNQMVHVKGKKDPIEVTYTMKKLCEELENQGFISCHKAFLVNYTYIKVIEKNVIYLTDGSTVYLSRRKVSEVKQKYLSLLKGESSILV